MPQLKDTGWQTGEKVKTHQCAVGNPSCMQDIQRLKIKGWRKIYQANREQKKAGVAILVSDKINFKPKKTKKTKKGIT